jgi:cytochrome b561
MKRYHPLLVAMHWIIAIMIVMALVIGGPSLADLKSTDPLKVTALGGHMVWGMVIGGLLIIRLVTRFTTQRPPAADAKNDLLNLGGRLAHWGLYLLTIAMVGSGMATAFSAGLFGMTLGGNGLPLPADLTIYAPRVAHGIIATLLLGLVVLHVAAWAYHQFYLKDRLISRIWFGKRKAD